MASHRNLTKVLIGVIVLAVIVGAGFFWFRTYGPGSKEIQTSVSKNPAIHELNGLILSKNAAGFTLMVTNTDIDSKLPTRFIFVATSTTIQAQYTLRTDADYASAVSYYQNEIQLYERNNDPAAKAFIYSHPYPNQWTYATSSLSDLKVGDQVQVAADPSVDMRSAASIVAATVQVTQPASTQQSATSSAVSMRAPHENALALAVGSLVNKVLSFTPQAYASASQHVGYLYWSGSWTSNSYWCDSGYSLAFYSHTNSGNNQNSGWYACIGNDTITTAISASPTSVTYGGSSTIGWYSQYATSCSINGGGVAGSGTMTVTPGSTTTYTLTCSGPGGSSSSSATVSVANPAPVTSISANPTSINQGAGTTLYFSETNAATSCSISNYGGVGASGAVAVYPASTTTYTYTCSGPGGTGSSAVTIYVNQNPVGNYDSGSCSSANGWAYDPDTTSQSIHVNVWMDGWTAGYDYVANGYRPDVQSAFGLPIPYYGFNWPVPNTYSDGNTHTMTVYAIDSQGGNNPSLGTVSFNCESDLYPDQIANASMPLGQGVTVYATIHNQGTGPTNGPFDNMFVTDLNAQGSAWGTIVASNYGNPMPALAAGGTSYDSVTFPASDFPTAGNYLYAFCTDRNTSWGTQIAESNQNNNCSTATITVTAANLTASTGGTVTAQDYTPISLGSTVSNTGNATAGSFNNILQVCDANCTGIDSITPATGIGSMGAGGSQAIAATYTPTVYSAQDQLYYRFCANYNTSWQTSVTESNYSDNCGNFAVLYVNPPSGSISASPNPCTITSGGSCTTTISWSTNSAATEVWVSGNGGSQSDFANSGASGSSAAPWIPQPGNYDTFYLYDYSSGSRGNLLGQVTVTGIEPNITTSTGAPATATINQPITLSETVNNTGNAAIPSAFPSILQICDGGCANINTQASIPATTIYSLGAGASQTISGTYTPTFPTYSALYYRICANYNSSWANVIDESNFGDNCGSWQTLTVQVPDITAGTYVTAAGTIGTPMTLTGGVADAGTAAAGSFPNVLQVCDITGGVACNNLNNVSAATTVTSLATGISVPVSGTYTPTTAGTYYYRMCGNLTTSWVNSITESNYNNNCSGWETLTITPPVPPTPTNPVTSCSVDGTHVSFSWTPSPGATNYYPRMYAPTAAQCTSYGWQMWTDGLTCYPNPDTDTATSFASFPITPGQAYTWYVSSANSGGDNGVNLSQNFSCAGLADLVGYPGVVSSEPANTSIVFNGGAVENHGTGTATSFPNLIQICDTASCTNYNNTVAANVISSMSPSPSAFQNVNATITMPTTPGNYVFRACANETTSWVNSVSESNYSNNCSSWQTLTVTPPSAPSCSASPTNPTVGQTVTYTATPGSGDTSPFTWTDSDGFTTTGNPITRTYSAVGSYSMGVASANGSPKGYCANETVGCAGTPTPSITPGSGQNRVNQGSSVTLTLSGQNVNTSCVLSANGVALQTYTPTMCTVAATNYTASNIQEQTKFCYTCDGGTPACTVVNVIPKFKEF